jgi:hypothetical protein
MKPKILVPILVVAIVGAIAGALYTQIWNPSWNPFGLSPQQRLEKSVANLSSLKTFKTDGRIEVNIEQKEETPNLPKNFVISFLFSQTTDNTDKENPKTEGNYSLSLGAEGMEISLAGEIKTIGEDIYLKVTSLPPLPFLGETFTKLKNQWVKIEKEKLMEISGQKKEEVEKETKRYLNFLEEIKNLLWGREIFEVKKNLGEEKIDNARAYHYLIKVNRDELKKLIPELIEKTNEYLQEEKQGISQEELQKFLEDFPQKFDQIYDKIGEISFEVWIGKRDNYLRKIKGAKEVDLGLFEELKDYSAIKNAKIKIGFDVRFSEFNQKVKIEAPKDFKLIDEVLPSEMFGTSTLPEIKIEAPKDSN